MSADEACAADCIQSRLDDTAKSTSTNKAQLAEVKTYNSSPVASPQSGMDDAAILADFAVWRDSLVARGFFKPRPMWQLVWFLAEPLAITALGCWMMKAAGSVVPGKLDLVLIWQFAVAAASRMGRYVWRLATLQAGSQGGVLWLAPG